MHTTLTQPIKAIYVLILPDIATWLACSVTMHRKQWVRSSLGHYEHVHWIKVIQSILSCAYFINDYVGLLFPFKGPDNREIQVENLLSGLFVEDKESKTFSVNFTWESPSFKHSVVHSYIISYEFDGYSREQISCSPGLVRDKDRPGCSKRGVVS